LQSHKEQEPVPHEGALILSTSWCGHRQILNGCGCTLFIMGSSPRINKLKSGVSHMLSEYFGDRTKTKTSQCTEINFVAQDVNMKRRNEKTHKKDTDTNFLLSR
jgi:hypothetical protein